MGEPQMCAAATAKETVLVDLLDDDEQITIAHELLMVFHFIVAMCVFGVLGYAFHYESKRMHNLKLARDGSSAESSQAKKKRLEETEDIHRKKHVARKFAAEYALYRVDYFLSTAAFAKPLLLLLLTYIIIIFGGFFYSYISGIPLLEALWLSWTMVADPGAHSDTRGTLLRFVSLTLTLAGMLVFALMIGIVADGVSNFLDSLKQGHAGVVEIEHTLILGWSQKTLPCIRELCLANESLHGRGVVVVLADREKQAMETELRAAFSPEDLRGTLVVCRSGRITNEKDLRKVSARHAKSIIVLADTTMDADASDARAVRVVMCLAKIFQEQESRVNGHLVVELCDVDNKDLIPLIAPMNCEVVVSHDMIGRMMIVSARQPGLTHVLQQILTFEGAEFYFKNWPELTGKTFGEVSFLFKDAIPLGVKPFDRADALVQLAKSKFSVDVASKSNRKVLLNPPDDYVLRAEDLVLVLAEDDDCYAPCTSLGEIGKEVVKAFESVKPVPVPPRRGTPESFLFCGSRRDMDDMIIELDQMVAPKSTLTLMSNVDIEKQKKRLMEGGLNLSAVKNLTVTFVQGNHVLRRDLEKLPLESFSSILILAEEDYENTMDEADSRTLTCLLLIRDIIAKRLMLNDAPTVESGKIKIMATTETRRDSDSKEDELERADSKPSSSGIISGGMLSGPSFAGRRLKLKSPTSNSVVALTRRANPSGGADVYYETGAHGGEFIFAANEDEEAKQSINIAHVCDTDGHRPEQVAAGSGQQQQQVHRPSLLHQLSVEELPGGELVTMGPSSMDTLQSMQTIVYSPTSSSATPPQTGTAAKHETDIWSISTSSSSLTTSSDSPPNTNHYFTYSASSVAKTIILCEILDTQTKALMPIAKVTDNLLSNEIISSCLSLIAESASTNDVLSELLQPEGNDIKLVSSLDYGEQGEEISLWMLSARVRSRGEVLLGYKIVSGGDGKAVLNPQDKSQRILLNVRTMLITISENI